MILLDNEEVMLVSYFYLQELKLKGQMKPYDKENLKMIPQSRLSVYRASRVYAVPESTLRDRTRNNVKPACSSGPERLQERRRNAARTRA